MLKRYFCLAVVCLAAIISAGCGGCPGSCVVYGECLPGRSAIVYFEKCDGTISQKQVFVTEGHHIVASPDCNRILGINCDFWYI
jgi:hypothetical protein